MARRLFPNEGQRLVYSPGVRRGSALTSSRGVEVIIWTAATDGERADILDANGDPIEDSLITVDENSLLPHFYGPDGVDEVFLEVAGASERVALIPQNPAATEEAVTPIELLPTTFSRFAPWTSWRYGNYIDPQTPPGVLGQRPPTQPQGPINVMLIPFGGDSPAQPYTASWGGTPLTLLPDNIGPYRISARAATISIDPQTPAADPVELVVTLHWMEATAAVSGSDTTPGDPIVLGPIDWIGISDPDIALSNTEAFPIVGAEVTIPDGITNPVLSFVTAYLRDEATGDPLGQTGNLFVLASISMYQGSTTLVPRLTASNQFIQGVSDPSVLALRIGQGAFFSNRGIDFDPNKMSFKQWGAGYSADPEYEASIEWGLDISGTPFPYIYVPSALRVNSAPVAPTDVVRLGDLQGGLSTLIVPDFSSGIEIDASGQTSIEIPYDRHVVSVANIDSATNLQLIFINPGANKYARYILRVLQPSSGDSSIFTNQNINLNLGGLGGGPDLWTVWDVIVSGQNDPGVGDPASGSMVPIASNVA